jgi:tetratricopeptide (TPR) repeat protein
LVRASGGLDEVPWLRRDKGVDRARIFILCWAAVVFAGVSALPDLNYSFRIRYGIITMVPVSLLVAWALGALVSAARSKDLPRWGLVAATVAVSLQLSVNLYRSAMYRRDIGTVMASIDQAYAYMEKNFRSEKAALMPNFLSYDYRPGSGPWFLGRERVGGNEELARRFPSNKTYVFDWSPSLWERLEHVELFDGCARGVLFDWLVPCKPGVGVYLSRLIPEDPDFQAGEKLRNERKFGEAAVRHGAFLDRYPGSSIGKFLLGLELIELKRYEQADSLYGELEVLFPSHRAIVYNRAVIRMGLADYAGASRRLSGLNETEPGNYGVMMNLYDCLDKLGDLGSKRVLRDLHAAFPADPTVQKLVAAGKHL